MLLQRDVHHRRIGTGAVPVLFPRRDPDRVAGTDFAHRAAPERNAPDAGDDVQGLAERMGMPCGARPRFETHERAPDARRRRCLDDRVLPHRAGEIVRRRAARGHGAQRFDIHGGVSSPHSNVRCLRS